jgi:hypothetical protein
MHALQTLLENHADLAFDFFEAWCHRNIFVVADDLPIVAPHQRGLDLEVPLERERELQIEVETLRRKLDNVSVHIPSFVGLSLSYIADAKTIRENTKMRSAGRCEQTEGGSTIKQHQFR